MTEGSGFCSHKPRVRIDLYFALLMQDIKTNSNMKHRSKILKHFATSLSQNKNKNDPLTFSPTWNSIVLFLHFITSTEVHVGTVLPLHCYVQGSWSHPPHHTYFNANLITREKGLHFHLE